MKKKFTTYLPEEIIQWLKVQAAKEGVTPNIVIEKAIEELRKKIEK